MMVASVGLFCQLEGESYEPGCADDDVDLVLDTGVVDEAIWCDFLELVGVYGGVWGGEGFEVSWSGRGSSAARVEVFGDDG